MENENIDSGIIYAPLPVDKPCPVLRPNSRIQLAPTVYPVALVPYVARPEDDAAPDEEEAGKEENKLPVRLCGLMMFTVIVFTIVMFVLAALNPFPFEGKAGKVLNIGFYTSRMAAAFKPGSEFADAFPSGLIVIGLVACAVNLFWSVVAMLAGKRPGYGVAAFVMFMTFAVAALYRMGIFSSEIMNITKVLDTEYGWASIMLLIICSVNALAAFLCACICPKNHIVDKADL